MQKVRNSLIKGYHLDSCKMWASSHIVFLLVIYATFDGYAITSIAIYGLFWRSASRFVPAFACDNDAILLLCPRVKYVPSSPVKLDAACERNSS